MALGNYGLKPTTVHTGTTTLRDHVVVVAGRTIAGVVAAGQVPSDLAVVELPGFAIAPGFVDLQVNGAGDVLFNREPTVDAVRDIVAAHRRFGTTHLLPTFITGPVDGMLRAAEAVRKYCEQGEKGVLGIHFEGPILSPARAGVHDPTYLKDRVDEGVLAAVDALGPLPVMMTVAPEVVRADDITLLRERGVRLAAGHTDADAATTRRALAAGITGATHLFNAMSPLTSRAPGAVGALIVDPETWVDVIPDGHHVDFTSLTVAMRAKPPGKFFFVTDSMPPAAGGGKPFDLGPYRVELRDGACFTEQGVLAGSALDMATAVRNGVRHLGVALDEALRMASLYPARYFGVDHRIGHLRRGYEASMVIFDEDVAVRGVVTEGELTLFD